MPDPFAEISDIELLWRTLDEPEARRADALLPVISDTIRQAAKDRGRDIDDMLSNGEVYENAIKSVVVDVVKRLLTEPDHAQPITQTTETAGPYSQSATYLTPSYGVLIYDNELARIGIKHRQRMSMIDADVGVFERRNGQS